MEEHQPYSGLHRFLQAFSKKGKPPPDGVHFVHVLYRLAKMEEEAQAYYEGLARHSDLQWVRSFAGHLAVMEQRHKIAFLEQARELEMMNGKTALPSELSEEVRQILATGIVPRAAPTDATAVYFSERDAVQFALLAEIKTIRLLEALRPHVPPEQQDALHRVLLEEHEHKRTIEALYRKNFGEKHPPS